METTLAPPIETFAELRDRVAALTPAERLARLAELERELRRTEAELAVLVGAVERDRSYRSDGHRSIAGYLRGELRWSSNQITDRRRIARLLTETPAVIEHLHAGTIGIAQARRFGRAAANPRCGGQLADMVEVLLEQARVFEFGVFNDAIAGWERLADADGADRDAATHHDNRFLQLSEFDGVGRIQGQCGALDHAALTTVFDRYQHAEWLTDWDEAVATYGPDVARPMLARTQAQRNWDAFMRMIEDAVSTPPGSQRPEPIVNLVWTEHHAETELARTGLIPDDDDESNDDDQDEHDTAEPVSPITALNDWRCHTTTGLPVSPFEALQALLAGRFRRLVYDTSGVVIDQGRLQRFFDGATRRAVLMQFPTCVFPGCNRPADHCDADHLVDWQHGGRTDQRNGAPLCARHNQLKNHGYTIWRDPAGVFHTYRPDGTEIAPPPAPPGTSPPTRHAA